jgi:tetratricopeptide (TPR) repeat protein
MAVYGAPFAIEDAPRAAVNAAIEMRKRIEDFNREQDLEEPLGVHIGINTGLAIAGDISGPMIREFAVMGEAVNEASRLKDLSPRGEIYVGGETYRHTRDFFDYEPLPTISIEGLKTRMRPYELRSDRERLERDATHGGRRVVSPLVGRATELGTLATQVARLDETGGVACLVGEAGLGKSRLLAELAKKSEIGTARFFAARSLSIGKTLSYHPFVALFRAWAEITDDTSEADAVARLETAVSEGLPERAGEVFPFIATLMGMKLPPAHQARIEGIRGEALEKQILRSVKEVVEAMAAHEPAVLIFDDLHWADISSVELLTSLLPLAQDNRILFVLVFRPGFPETSERVADLARVELEDVLAEIRLTPLDSRDSRRHIDNFFQHGDVPRATCDMIAAKAAGNPFFVEEVVRSLIDEGAVQYRDGHLFATEKIHSVEIPGTIQEVLMARIDGLDLRDRNVLQTASVFGGSVPHEILADVLNKDDLDASVFFLTESQLVEPHERLHGVEYTFNHPLIEEVAYESIAIARRKRLHLQVAHAIEGNLTENVPGYHAMLAFHFGVGEDLESSEAHLFKAGDEAARSAASNEALHFFRQAAGAYFSMHGEGGDPQKKAMLESNVAMALSNRGQLLEAVEHFNQALRHLDVWVPRNFALLVPRLVRDIASALTWLYSSGYRRRRPAATPRQREVNILYHQRARAQATTDPTRYFIDAMNGWRRLNHLDPATVRHAGGQYATASALFSFGGMSFSLSRRMLDIASALVDREDGEEYSIFAFFNFLHHCLAGDLSDAHEVDSSVIDDFVRYGHLWEATNYLCFAVEKRIYQGHLEDAMEPIEILSNLTEVYAYDFAKTTHQAMVAYLLLERRELDAALEAAEIYYAENSEDLINLAGLSCIARIQTLRGDLTAAAEALSKSEAIVKRSGPVAPYYRTFHQHARLALDIAQMESAKELGDAVAVRSVARRAHRSGRRAVRAASRVVWHRPACRTLMGRGLWLAGRWRPALDAWREALDEAERLGLRPDVARAHLEIARALASGSGPPLDSGGLDADIHFERAASLFEEMGLAWDLARLERIRAGTPHLG